MNRIQIRFIKDALDNLDKLNDWEQNFIDSISDKDDNCKLSSAQNKTLNKISQKIQD